MARIKIDLPSTFSFQTSIDIRITDLNYGGHVGNDTILSIIHEARCRFLKHFGYAETNLEGIGLIMSDAGVEYKSELFYGDVVNISICATAFSKVTFELFYKIDKQTNGKAVAIATAKTGMVGYDYSSKKVAAIPQSVRLTLETQLNLP